MPHRFHFRGSLIVAILPGVTALLCCGGLFLLLGPLGPLGVPDAVAELKQFPVYPNATETALERSSAQSSAEDMVTKSSFATLKFETTDKADRLIDFYIGEFSKRGWTCSAAEGGNGNAELATRCRREDELLPQFAFTNAFPWVEIHRPRGWRNAKIVSYIWGNNNSPVRELSIRYTYLESP
jgi:hypothetical protein